MLSECRQIAVRMVSVREYLRKTMPPLVRGCVLKPSFALAIDIYRKASLHLSCNRIHPPLSSASLSHLCHRVLPLLSSRGPSFLYLVIARAKPVAIHCESVSEPHSPFGSCETRWIAASSCRPPRNDNRVLSSRGRSPWRSTVNQRAKR